MFPGKRIAEEYHLVQFLVVLDNETFKENFASFECCIAGNLNVLGNWNPQYSLTLLPVGKTTIFFGTAAFIQSPVAFEYKVILRAKGHVIWEEGPNRRWCPEDSFCILITDIRNMVNAPGELVSLRPSVAEQGDAEQCFNQRLQLIRDLTGDEEQLIHRFLFKLLFEHIFPSVETHLAALHAGATATAAEASHECAETLSSVISFGYLRFPPEDAPSVQVLVQRLFHLWAGCGLGAPILAQLDARALAPEQHRQASNAVSLVLVVALLFGAFENVVPVAEQLLPLLLPPESVYTSALAAAFGQQDFSVSEHLDAFCCGAVLALFVNETERLLGLLIREEVTVAALLVSSLSSAIVHGFYAHRLGIAARLILNHADHALTKRNDNADSVVVINDYEQSSSLLGRAKVPHILISSRARPVFLGISSKQSAGNIYDHAAMVIGSLPFPLFLFSHSRIRSPHVAAAAKALLQRHTNLRRYFSAICKLGHAEERCEDFSYQTARLVELFDGPRLPAPEKGANELKAKLTFSFQMHPTSPEFAEMCRHLKLTGNLEAVQCYSPGKLVEAYLGHAPRGAPRGSVLPFYYHSKRNLILVSPFDVGSKIALQLVQQSSIEHLHVRLWDIGGFNSKDELLISRLMSFAFTRGVARRRAPVVIFDSFTASLETLLHDWISIPPAERPSSELGVTLFPKLLVAVSPALLKTFSMTFLQNFETVHFDQLQMFNKKFSIVFQTALKILQRLTSVISSFLGFTEPAQWLAANPNALSSILSPWSAFETNGLSADEALRHSAWQVAYFVSDLLAQPYNPSSGEAAPHFVQTCSSAVLLFLRRLLEPPALYILRSLSDMRQLPAELRRLVSYRPQTPIDLLSTPKHKHYGRVIVGFTDFQVQPVPNEGHWVTPMQFLEYSSEFPPDSHRVIVSLPYNALSTLVLNLIEHASSLCEKEAYLAIFLFIPRAFAFQEECQFWTTLTHYFKRNVQFYRLDMPDNCESLADVIRLKHNKKTVKKIVESVNLQALLMTSPIHGARFKLKDVERLAADLSNDKEYFKLFNKICIKPAISELHDTLTTVAKNYLITQRASDVSPHYPFFSLCWFLVRRFWEVRTTAFFMNIIQEGTFPPACGTPRFRTFIAVLTSTSDILRETMKKNPGVFPNCPGIPPVIPQHISLNGTCNGLSHWVYAPTMVQWPDLTSPNDFPLFSVILRNISSPRFVNFISQVRVSAFSEYTAAEAEASPIASGRWITFQQSPQKELHGNAENSEDFYRLLGSSPDFPSISCQKFAQMYPEFEQGMRDRIFSRLTGDDADLFSQAILTMYGFENISLDAFELLTGISVEGNPLMVLLQLLSIPELLSHLECASVVCRCLQFGTRYRSTLEILARLPTCSPRLRLLASASTAASVLSQAIFCPVSSGKYNKQTNPTKLAEQLVSHLSSMEHSSDTLLSQTFKLSLLGKLNDHMFFEAHKDIFSEIRQFSWNKVWKGKVNLSSFSSTDMPSLWNSIGTSLGAIRSSSHPKGLCRFTIHLASFAVESGHPETAHWILLNLIRSLRLGSEVLLPPKKDSRVSSGFREFVMSLRPKQELHSFEFMRIIAVILSQQLSVPENLTVDMVSEALRKLCDPIMDPEHVILAALVLRLLRSACFQLCSNKLNHIGSYFTENLPQAAKLLDEAICAKGVSKPCALFIAKQLVATIFRKNKKSLTETRFWMRRHNLVNIPRFCALPIPEKYAFESLSYNPFVAIPGYQEALKAIHDGNGATLLKKIHAERKPVEGFAAAVSSLAFVFSRHEEHSSSGHSPLFSLRREVEYIGNVAEKLKMFRILGIINIIQSLFNSRSKRTWGIFHLAPASPIDHIRLVALVLHTAIVVIATTTYTRRDGALHGSPTLLDLLWPPPPSSQTSSYPPLSSRFLPGLPSDEWSTVLAASSKRDGRVTSVLSCRCGNITTLINACGLPPGNWKDFRCPKCGTHVVDLDHKLGGHGASIYKGRDIAKKFPQISSWLGKTVGDSKDKGYTEGANPPCNPEEAISEGPRGLRPRHYRVLHLVVHMLLLLSGNPPSCTTADRIRAHIEADLHALALMMKTTVEHAVVAVHIVLRKIVPLLSVLGPTSEKDRRKLEAICARAIGETLEDDTEARQKLAEWRVEHTFNEEIRALYMTDRGNVFEERRFQPFHMLWMPSYSLSRRESKFWSGLRKSLFEKSTETPFFSFTFNRELWKNLLSMNRWISVIRVSKAVKASIALLGKQPHDFQTQTILGPAAIQANLALPKRQHDTLIEMLEEVEAAGGSRGAVARQLRDEITANIHLAAEHLKENSPPQPTGQTAREEDYLLQPVIVFLLSDALFTNLRTVQAYVHAANTNNAVLHLSLAFARAGRPCKTLSQFQPFPKPKQRRDVCKISPDSLVQLPPLHAILELCHFRPPWHREPARPTPSKLSLQFNGHAMEQLLAHAILHGASYLTFDSIEDTVKSYSSPSALFAILAEIGASSEAPPRQGPRAPPNQQPLLLDMLTELFLKRAAFYKSTLPDKLASHYISLAPEAEGTFLRQVLREKVKHLRVDQISPLLRAMTLRVAPHIFRMCLPQRARGATRITFSAGHGSSFRDTKDFQGLSLLSFVSIMLVQQLATLSLTPAQVLRAVKEAFMDLHLFLAFANKLTPLIKKVMSQLLNADPHIDALLQFCIEFDALAGAAPE
eukprot:gnl/Chilomastix_cuspidata/3162.p1 GENE.gnl/Chilomastix_cuspidata/3162~~gnl/Chilomastix_cuspidata/3162.p1  ORF type:complete len:2677 (+),score=419.22 gnl/Chilomastix_cuspidata/3162:882-8912(+)